MAAGFLLPFISEGLPNLPFLRGKKLIEILLKLPLEA